MQAVAAKLSPVMHPTIASFRSLRRTLPANMKIGFVPTMGALHEGHLSLVKEAVAQNDLVVASVFVNPTQFGEGEDLDRYPRQLERDAEMLAEYGVDHLFAPMADEMYGKNHVSYVVPEGFDDIPEGVSRPGHFRGVATVVTKLFNIVQPTNAYFGQKDAAQCSLIRRIVEDLNMDVNVRVQDTIREADGLALSSRNAYLTPEERLAAPVLYRALCSAREVFHSNPSVSRDELVSIVTGIMSSEPLVAEIQYVSIDNKATMRPVESMAEEAVISLACKVGNVRLIDNIVL
eukprot:Nitzschia sp. Nitz4//scaffold1_size375055//354012//354952//NITZ4_000341-RA/size375055-augustus-gene-0.699-mRNA-1//1//CDS//3329541240//8105//frame0